LTDDFYVGPKIRSKSFPPARSSVTSYNLHEPSNKGYNFLHTSRNTVLKSSHTNNHVKLQAEDTILFLVKVIGAALLCWKLHRKNPKVQRRTQFCLSHRTHRLVVVQRELAGVMIYS